MSIMKLKFTCIYALIIGYFELYIYILLPSQNNWNIVESGIKHHKHIYTITPVSWQINSLN